MSNSQTQNDSKFKEFLNSFPIIQFVLAGFIGLAATYTTIQLNSNSQAAEIRKQSEKIERLEKDAVSRDLFDERTKFILENQKNFDSKLDRLLERK